MSVREFRELIADSEDMKDYLHALPKAVDLLERAEKDIALLQSDLITCKSEQLQLRGQIVELELAKAERDMLLKTIHSAATTIDGSTAMLIENTVKLEAAFENAKRQVRAAEDAKDEKSKDLIALGKRNADLARRLEEESARATALIEYGIRTVELIARYIEVRLADGSFPTPEDIRAGKWSES